MLKAAAGFAAGVLLGGLYFRAHSQSLRQQADKDKPVVAATAVGAFSLAGKNTVVTGAGSGIGYDIALLYAQQGATVHVLDVDADAASRAAGAISAAVGREGAAVPHAVDVANRDTVREVVTAIVAAHGAVDVLVNNAGVGAVGNVLKATEEEMRRLFDINVLGVFNCSQVAVESMLASGKGGSIVNLGSIASLIGLRDRFSYSMSKGAVLTMTYSLATDFVKDGIRCNAICPARIHTPFVDAYLKKHYAGQEAAKFKELSEYQPVGRMGTPKEVAALALYLAADESKFVTGSAYSIDGGVVCNMG